MKKIKYLLSFIIISLISMLILTPKIAYADTIELHPSNINMQLKNKNITYKHIVDKFNKYNLHTIIAHKCDELLRDYSPVNTYLYHEVYSKNYLPIPAYSKARKLSSKKYQPIENNMLNLYETNITYIENSLNIKSPNDLDNDIRYSLELNITSSNGNVIKRKKPSQVYYNPDISFQNHIAYNNNYPFIVKNISDNQSAIGKYILENKAVFENEDTNINSKLDVNPINYETKIPVQNIIFEVTKHKYKHPRLYTYHKELRNLSGNLNYLNHKEYLKNNEAESYYLQKNFYWYHLKIHILFDGDVKQTIFDVNTDCLDDFNISIKWTRISYGEFHLFNSNKIIDSDVIINQKILNQLPNKNTYLDILNNTDNNLTFKINNIAYDFKKPFIVKKIKIKKVKYHVNDKIKKIIFEDTNYIIDWDLTNNKINAQFYNKLISYFDKFNNRLFFNIPETDINNMIFEVHTYDNITYTYNLKSNFNNDRLLNFKKIRKVKSNLIYLNNINDINYKYHILTKSNINPDYYIDFENANIKYIEYIYVSNNFIDIPQNLKNVEINNNNSNNNITDPLPQQKNEKAINDNNNNNIKKEIISKKSIITILILFLSTFILIFVLVFIKNNQYNNKNS